MADIEVGDLVARISFDDTGLNKSMAQINRQMQVVQSEFQKASSALQGYGREEDLLNAKASSLSQQMQLQQQKINNLNQAFQKAAREKGLDAQQTQNLAVKLNKAQAEYSKLESELKQTNSQLNTQEKELSSLQRAWNDSMDQARQSVGNLSDQLKYVGAGITAVGAGIAAGLGVAVNKAADFEQGMANAYSVMAPDEVARFRDELEQLAITMGSDTKYSATEAAQGIEELVKAGVSVEDIMSGGLSGALSLATAGELELADAAEIASTALNAFRDDALDVNKAADILAGAANASATSVSELKFGLSQVSAVASSVGLSFEDTATALAVFAQNGLKGSDAGTSLKTMLTRLTPTTTEAYEQFDELGLISFQTADALEYLTKNGIKPASTQTKDVVDALMTYAAKSVGAKVGTDKANKAFRDMAFQVGALSSVFYDANGDLKGMAEISGILQDSMSHLNSEQHLVAMNTMFGSDAIRAANILFKEGAEGVNTMATAMGKISAADVAKQKMDTLKGAVEELNGSMETAQISIGDALVPAIRTISSWVQKLVDRFNDLSPSAKSFIAIGGAIAAALALIIGPITLLIGFLPQIAAGFTMLAPALGPILAITAGIAGLVAGGMALYNHLNKESIPEIQRFGKEVSASTQKAVGGFLDLNDQATMALNQLQWSGQTVTAQTAQSIITTFSQMGDQVLVAMKEDHAAQLQEMTNFYASTSVLTEQEEQAALAKMKEYQTAQTTAIQEGQARIKEIMETAKAEKRAITDAERNEINKIQQEMVKTGIKHMSENELEQKAILERMRQNASALSARQAAEVVKNSVKQRDETIKAAEEQYNDVVKEIIRQRDEVGSITKEQADKLIAEAKKQRDGAVKHAQSMHNDVLKEAKAQAREHVNQVDWETGNILTKWQTFVNKVKEKWQQLKQWAANIFGDLFKTINNKTEEIKTSVVNKWNDIVNFFKNIDLKKIGADIMNGLKNGIKSKTQELYQEAINISSKIGKAIRDFFNIKSPSRLMMGYGEYISEGLAIGIEDAGKQAVKAAEDVAQGTSDGIRKTLQINSPSKVTTKLGEETGEGLSVGLKNKKKKVKKSAEELAKAAFDASKKWIDDRKYYNELSLEQELKVWQKISQKYKAGTEQRKQADREVYRIKQELIKAEQEAEKKAFDQSKTWIESKKELNKLSLAEELAAWERLTARQKEGSAERAEAEKQVMRVRQTIYTELKAASDDYLAKVKQVNENVAAEEQRLNEVYEQAVENRTKSIYSFAGLFDEVAQKAEVSGQQLVENLKGQVETITEWSEALNLLGKRGLDDGLMSELREMGPKAAAEIMALNSLTDAELTEYQNLWRTKNQMARTQAVRELEGLRVDTLQQIKDLNVKAAAELDVLQKEFADRVKKIRSGTKNEFNAMTASMPEIGREIINGLMAGIDEMAGPLKNKVSQLSKSISNTIKNTLKIKSPSRVTMGLGEFVSEGLAVGIENAQGLAVQSAKNLSGAVANAMATDAAKVAVSTSGAAAQQAATNHNVNMYGLFAGANIHIREDNDIRKLAQQIGSLTTGNTRGLGGAPA